MAVSWFFVRVMALFLCVLFGGVLPRVAAVTDVADVNALNALMQAWTSSPATWVGDPCSVPWDGVTCDTANATVIGLSLDSKGIQGTLSSAIGGLHNLASLTISSNPGLTGQLPKEIGSLAHLRVLSAQYCGFSGPLPAEIGNLRSLNFLGLNGNGFNGPLPAELGLNPNMTWLDISDNAFSGNIPTSTNSGKGIGLDNITNIVHFHLNNNSFSGSFPVEILDMPRVQHLLVDHNQLSGKLENLPPISPALQILRLDFNDFSGPVPTEFTTATGIFELNIRNNSFSGALPNFTSLVELNFLDLSYNNFDAQEFPLWITSFENLTTLNLVSTRLTGTVPPQIFDLPKIQALDLSFNDLNGTLLFTQPASPELVLVDLANNQIQGISGDPTYRGVNSYGLPANLTLWLQNNPICSNMFLVIPACGNLQSQVWQHPATNFTCDVVRNTCSDGKILNPYTCSCAFPLELTLLLTAPVYTNLDSITIPLEQHLNENLNLITNQTYISNMIYLPTARVEVFVNIFPLSGDTFPSQDGDIIISRLRQHRFSLPEGPYLLPNAVYASLISSSRRLSTAAIIGIVVGCAAGVMIIGGSIFLAVYQKLRADRAVMNNPFASWGGGGGDMGDAPQLKGARWFSLAELKTYTNHWSDDNLLGEGGYGKVYRGTLASGELVAIKRATEGSMQGANEFKNEIELLSRVHHRNLVGLIGFCYEGGEQALIYEFMSNGTLDDHLKGKGHIILNWNRRMEIILASARGLAYLHDSASPPIIHRDIKSSNILLNDKLVAKVADFGLSKLAPDEGEKLVYSVHVKGTLGYLDPEYYMTQNLTDKSDVYSFGVVLLEILTAKPPIYGGKFVVREFRTTIDKGGYAAVLPLLDPTLEDVSLEELEQYLKLALRCVEETSEDRPTISEIVKYLEGLEVFQHSKPGALELDNGGKKVKFSDSVESDEAELLDKANTNDPAYRYQQASRESFKYSGAFGVSTTIRPK